MLQPNTNAKHPEHDRDKSSWKRKTTFFNVVVLIAFVSIFSNFKVFESELDISGAKLRAHNTKSKSEINQVQTKHNNVASDLPLPYAEQGDSAEKTSVHSNMGAVEQKQGVNNDNVEEEAERNGDTVQAEDIANNEPELEQKGWSPPFFELPPIFFVWLGNIAIETRPLQQGAIESCRKLNEGVFEVKVITDDDLLSPMEKLGFELHPSFHLLDKVQRSDYLRLELIHNHGGIYLDTDVFCVRPFARHLAIFEEENVLGGGAASRAPKNLRNIDWSNVGPFLPNTSYTKAAHKSLWEHADGVQPKMEECAEEYPDGNGGIAWPEEIRFSRSGLCGTFVRRRI